MINNKPSLYRPEEEKNLRELMDQFDKKEIDVNYFEIETNKYMLLCEGRKNRIRFNNITEDDIKNGFTPYNFPYLMDSDFYSEEERRKFLEINKNNNK